MRRPPEPSGRVAAVEFADVVRRRRMVRDYDPDRPVPRRGARAAARARHPGAVGRASARAGRSWCWRRREERELFWTATTDDGTPDGWLTRMRRAPLLIVPLSNKSAYLDRYAEPDKGWTDRDESRWPVPYWDVDAGMASLLMLLTAVDEGLGACFFGVPPERDRGVPGGVRRARGVPAGRLRVGRLPRGRRPPLPLAAPRPARRRRGRAPRPVVTRGCSVQRDRSRPPARGRRCASRRRRRRAAAG